MTDRRPRLPGAIYSVLAAGLAVAVAVVSLSATLTPPPTIAEFAPQAREVIEDAPEEQTSAFGSAEGGAERDVDATPIPGERDVPAVDLPRTRRCVGDPPRQIEDPQSPPCVPFWEGDNGGATANGVTGNEIRVFIPAGDYNGHVPQDVSEAMAAFFNRRFEFYGRKLSLLFPTEGDDGGEPEDQDAMAAHAISMGPFAALGYANASARVYHTRMGQAGVVTTTGVLGNDEWSESEMATFAPSVWSYQMAADRILVNLGEWTCKRLAGRDAVHGGDDVASAPRRFGVVIRPWSDQDEPLDTQPLEDELARCSAKIESEMVNPTDDAQGRLNTILQMQEQDVTSIFCLCNYFFWQQLMLTASSQDYHPEWLSSTLGLHDVNHNIKLPFAPGPDQTDHVFGITVRPRQIRLEDEPFWWAVSEGDRSADGSRYTEATAAWTGGDAYRIMLLVASGIQMAGPTLTAETFEDGLRRTTFPNPDHPIRAGAVGFSGSHAMTIDAAEWWYSSAARSPYPGDTPGTICYVDGGTRHRRGAWPSGPGASFDGPCDTGA